MGFWGVCSYFRKLFHASSGLGPSIATERRKKIRCAPIGFSSYVPESLRTLTAFGEGGASARLGARHLSTELRLKSLLAVEAAQTRTSNAILRESLADQNDEIRLLAFGLLARQEKIINDAMHHAREKLKKSENAVEKALCAKELALLYWN